MNILGVQIEQFGIWENFRVDDIRDDVTVI